MLIYIFWADQKTNWNLLCGKRLTYKIYLLSFPEFQPPHTRKFVAMVACQITKPVINQLPNYESQYINGYDWKQLINQKWPN
jgi:hypothetical protein